MNSIDERNVDPVDEMTRIAQNALHLTARGFIESFRSAKPAKIIYDSEWCRISLGWKGWDYIGGNSIRIVYGRLHAPSEKNRLLWRGEDCYCWHNLDYVLHFLDGLGPIDAARLGSSHAVTDPFYEEKFRKQFQRRQPEWLALMNVAVWQSYGKRLFDLFDLRQPELWEQYCQFLKAVYDNIGRIPEITPPLDKVC